MALRSAHVLSSVEAAFGAKDAASRVGAFTLITALVELCKAAVEPYLIPLVGRCLEGCADKAADVHAAALGAGRAITNTMCPYGARFVLPQVRPLRRPTAKMTHPPPNLTQTRRRRADHGGDGVDGALAAKVRRVRAAARYDDACARAERTLPAHLHPAPARPHDGRARRGARGGAGGHAVCAHARRQPRPRGPPPGAQAHWLPSAQRCLDSSSCATPLPTLCC